MAGLLGEALNNFLFESKKKEVWEKGQLVAGRDPDKYRMDKFGNLIRYSSYGTLTKLGWEIDHIFPESLGGSDDISNLQPLQWEANRKKGDKLL